VSKLKKRKRGRPVKHGLSRTRAYTRWRWLWYAHTHKRWSRKRYHGHEITLCKEWRGIKGLVQFCKDMGEPPEPGAEVEFIDITKPASKSNCYWKTRAVELTPEEVKLTADRLDFIGNYKNLLTSWELKTFSRVRNCLKSNVPISKRCFFKIREIYDKIQSALSISRQAVNPPLATTVGTPTPRSGWGDPTENWERLLELEEKLKGTSSISHQTVKPPPATTIDTPAPQKTTWETLLELEEKLRRFPAKP